MVCLQNFHADLAVGIFTFNQLYFTLKHFFLFEAMETGSTCIQRTLSVLCNGDFM